MNSFNALLTSCALLLWSTGCEKDTRTPTVQKAEGTSAKEDKTKETSAESLSEVVAEAVIPTEIRTSEKISASFKDGSSIEQSAVLKRIQTLNERVQALPFMQLYNLVLFVMIQEHLGYSEAIRAGLDKDPKLSKELRTIEKALLRQRYLDGETKDKITSETIKKQYDELMKGFKEEDEVGLRLILVKDREQAKTIIKALKDGGNFDELQKQHTQKNIGKDGFVGYFRKSALPLESADLIMKTAVGSVVSEPVIIPNTGLAILFVSDKRKTQKTPLEKAEPRIRDILKQRLGLECINSLLFKHKAKIFSPTGEVIPIKTIDERLEEVRAKQNRKDEQPSEEEMRKEDSVNKLTDTHVVAEYDDGKKVTFAQVSDFIRDNTSMLRGLTPYEVYVTATEEYLNDLFVNQEIEAKKIASDPEVQKQIKETTHSLMAQSFWAQQARALMTDAEMRKQFEKIISKIDPNEMETRLRVIPVKTEQEGLKVIKELQGGKAFEVVLAEHATDPRLKENKGDLGYLKKDQLTMLSSAVASAVNKAAKATFLQKPFEINGQLFVIRVDDKRKVEVPTFAQTKEFLKQHLQQEYIVTATINAIQKEGVSAWDFNGKSIDLSKREEVEKHLNPSPAVAPANAPTAKRP